MTQADNERKERNPARTDTALKALKKEGKSYQVPIERGLYVEVLPNGTKAFRFRYMFNGRREKLTFGAYPDSPSATRGKTLMLRGRCSRPASRRCG